MFVSKPSPSLRGECEQPGRHLKLREEENLSVKKEKLGKLGKRSTWARGIPVTRSTLVFPLPTATCRWTSPGRCSWSKDQEKGAPESLGFGEVGITEKTELEIMIR